MSSLRWRALIAGSAVITAVVPAVAFATSPRLTCRTVSNVGLWQKVAVDPFHDVPGVATVDKVTAYAVDAAHPGTVVTTNGTTIKRSTHSGCDWTDVFSLGLQPSAEVPLSGQTAKITATAVINGRVLAAVREGVGAASRPHVVGSDSGRPGTFAASDTGLPPQGAPTLIRAASDGRTVYLVLTPVAQDNSGPVDTGGLPSLPPVEPPTTSGGKAGLLYASTDGGHSWALRTSAADLPAGAGLDQITVDRGDANLVYATSNGLLYTSRDGGATFSRARVNNEDVTAVETMSPGAVAAFTRSGLILHSANGGRTFTSTKFFLNDITSAAYRAGDSNLAVESSGLLAILDPATGAATALGGPTAVRGSLTGDVAPQSTYHGLSGHSLIRYADPPPVNAVDTPVSVDDLGVPPPPPGRITPGSRTVQLKVGTSGIYDYTLSMPKSPTPLDLFFLIDTSGSMSSYIDNLKTNINKVVHAIEGAGINLNVGVGTLGTGPRPGEVVPPYFNPNDPNDRGSKLYALFRRIGLPDADFAKALASVKVETQGGNNPAEAQLAALEQATFGPGIKDPNSPAAAPIFIVPPGQDAGWRANPGIRRIIVHATDEAFDYPSGSPVKPDGCGCHLDFDKVIREMNANRVQQIGITTGAIESREDLSKIARGTHTLAPQGGSDCGEGEVLPAGSPLVCDTEGDFSAIIGRLVKSLQDHADVSLSARGSFGKVIRGLDASRLQGVDVTKPNVLPFRVAVTCKGLSPGTYHEDITAGLRGVRIATSKLTVDCLGPAAAARLLPPVAVALTVPPPPPAPVAVVPAPPAAQPQAAPQGQAQAQTQVNPMTAAAMQRQEQLQLALALQAGQERPATEEEMAMVGRRHEDEGAALVLLAAAAMSSAAFGLARLRSRPEPSPVRIR
ncbi:MAG: exo-alpha-sialidase [Frankiales bacterium]|nr:exo-alpha-sialidase [Frankiales bacterium]